MMLSRNRLVAVALALLVLGSIPVAAGVTVQPPTDPEQAYDDKLSGPAEAINDVVGFNNPDWLITYGADQTPGFYVTYTDGKLGSLETWANGTEARRILSYDNDSNRALVTAPNPDVYGGFLVRDRVVAGVSLPRPSWVSTPLLARGYVERVDVNQRTSMITPVQLQPEADAHSPPVPSAMVQGGWNTDGVAFSTEVNKSTMGDVRDTVGADSVSADGSGVKVAVLDCGFNTNQGTLFGNGSYNSSTRVSDAKNFITDENATAGNGFQNVSSSCLHGTWVASAVAANASNTTYDGVAPNATLMFGKVLDDDGSGSIENVREGVEWAEANDADIIQMSLGSQIYSATLHAEIAEALNGSTSMVVVAAGNSRMNPAARYISSPADTPHPGVVAVAASETAAPQNASVAYFSEVGPDGAIADSSRGVTVGQGPDLAAPGMEVEAAVLDSGGNRVNKTLSGTSMASPIVSGVLALEYDKHSGALNETRTTRARLLNTSSAMNLTGTTEVGHGMVNASNLLAHDNTTLTQRSARTTAARSRDKANRGTSGSRFYRVISVASSRLTILSVGPPPIAG